MFLYDLKHADNKHYRRFAFIIIMTISAPIFGGLQSYRKLRWQEDFLSDMLQVELIIAIGTLITAFAFWTLLNRKYESKMRGGVAGLFTAICIVPLPVFGWSFKNQLMIRLKNPDHGFFADIILSLLSAAHIALPIFTSKAIIALPLSFAVGYWVARHKTKGLPA